MTSSRLGPSILTADLLRLGEQIREAEEAGVDFIHLDVMDGIFVPNITIGPLIVETVRAATPLPLDVHLMIDRPERFVDAFIAAGADLITIHVEACTHLHGTLSRITEAGAIAGVTLNPTTPLVAIEEALPFVGQLLIMSVNPGFGGQTFIPAMLDKIRRARELIEDRHPTCLLEVDGGIKPSNVRRVLDAGADTIVAGSAIYLPGTPVPAAVAAMRAAMNHTAS